MYMRRTERKGKERRWERIYMCAKRRKNCCVVIGDEK